MNVEERLQPDENELRKFEQPIINLGEKFKEMYFEKKSIINAEAAPVNGRYIDLRLPKDKTPMLHQDYLEGKRWDWEIKRRERRIKTEVISDEIKIETVKSYTHGKAGKFIEDAIKEQESTANKKWQSDQENLKNWRDWGNSCPENLTNNEKPRRNVGYKTFALGSEEEIYSTGDIGLLGAVLEAYNQHWNLRISPDDVWFPVAKKVAVTIDRKSKSNKIRDYFVNFQGKKEIKIETEAPSIYHVSYPWLFDQFSAAIRENIKVPSYADLIRSDFTTTTPELQIVSDINLMSSLQEYFEYSFTLGCGIKGVEMLGELEDWKKLVAKIEKLANMLSPIDDELQLIDWLIRVKDMFTKLVATYEGSPDTNWWSKIFTQVPYGSGGQVKFTGWIIDLLEGQTQVNELSSLSSGVTSVPVKILFGEIVETAALAAGMLGFTVHDGKETGNGIPSVRPFQGWTLLLLEKSVFRNV